MSKPSPLRVGIVGAGLMGRWHAYYAQRLGERVVAIIDSDERSAKDLLDRCRDATRFGTLTECLDRGDVDALHVCTPTQSHVALAHACLQAGKHVLVEKPLCWSSADVRTLMEAARSTGAKLGVVHQFPYQRGFARLRSLLPHVGKIVSAHWTIRSAGGDGKAESEQQRIRDEMLPHGLSLLWGPFGELPSPDDWRLLQCIRGDILVSATLRDSAVTMEISLHGRPPRNHFAVVGTEGTVHLDLFHGFAWVARGSASRGGKILAPFSDGGSLLAAASVNLLTRAIRRQPAYPGLMELLQNFYRSVRDDRDPIPLAEILAITETASSLRTMMSPE